jgi:hypothetical protein
MHGSTMWLNLDKYTGIELLLFGVGGLGWVIVYAHVLYGVRKHRFVEIPAVAVVSNVAWEFVWGIVFKTDLGELFVWGYRTWFFLDGFITYSLFKYGSKQFSEPSLKKHFRPAAAAGIAGFVLFNYLFKTQGYELPTGLVSGYGVTLMMSLLWIPFLLRQESARYFSYLVAWAKMVGTAIASVFCFLALADNVFLLYLCVLTFLSDLLYVVILHRRKAEDRASGAPALAQAS